MHKDGKDDAPTFEEILASIRRIVSEAARDPADAPPPDLPNFAELAKALDPDGDFELPALYRGPLRGGGELSPPPTQHRRDDDAPFDTRKPVADASFSSAREAAQATAHGSEPWIESLSAAAPALKEVQGGSPGQEVPTSFFARSADTGAPRPPHVPALQQDAKIVDISVPRTMSPCTDTVISRMGQARRPLDELPTPPMNANRSIYDGIPSSKSADPVSRKSQVQSPDRPIGALLSGRLGDSAAEAIRPLVREWLDTNMRLVLEKALRDELKSRASGSGED